MRGDSHHRSKPAGQGRTGSVGERRSAGGHRAHKPRTGVTSLVHQAVRAVLGRRARSLLTACGIALGIAATVATVGISATAGAAISDRFDAVQATLVTIRFHEGPVRPERAVVDRVRRLNGVVAAGLLCQSTDPDRATRVRPDLADGSGTSVNVFAAEPAALDVLNVTLVSGRFFDDGHDMRGDAVAIIDTVAANDLGVDTRTNPIIYLDGSPVTVLGVYQAPPGEARLTRAAVVPYQACVDEPTSGGFLPPDAVIRTTLGAADQIAGQARLALSPIDPDAVDALVPPDLRTFRQGVERETQALFLGLALVSLIIGALGVSNTTLVSVMERRSEIGLRRAVGASRLAIGGQFLIESTILGLAGGILGTAAGINITAVVAIAKNWLVLIDPGLTALGPAVGVAVGILAGIYPAWAATRVTPVQSLRSA